MDLKTCLVGAAPPFLAMLAEKWNPISSDMVWKQSFELATQHIPTQGLTDQQRDAQKSALARTMAGIAVGASEASGLIPTWIAIISALTAVFIDIVDPIACLVIAAFVTTMSAILGIRFFSSLELYNFGTRAAGCFGCRKITRAECASRWVIVFNGMLTGTVVIVWLCTSVVPGFF